MFARLFDEIEFVELTFSIVFHSVIEKTKNNMENIKIEKMILVLFKELEGLPVSMFLVIKIANIIKTDIAPTYTRISIIARNSARNKINIRATVINEKIRNNAERNKLVDKTTIKEEIIIGIAIIQKIKSIVNFSSISENNYLLPHLLACSVSEGFS